jgi:hypothetical protein
VMCRCVHVGAGDQTWRMYSDRERADALQRLGSGHSLSRVARDLAISRAALRAWRDGVPRLARSSGCPRCDGTELDHPAYSCLLGYYLGDGCLSAARRYVALRISCDAIYPGIVGDAHGAVAAVRPGARVFHVTAPGVVVVQSHWKHWPCLFPQHGPGRKPWVEQG